MKQYEVELTIIAPILVTVEAEDVESITSQHINDALSEMGFSVGWVVDSVTPITEEEND